jgi:hypothetical protein
MSDDLLETAQLDMPYLQSPIDDLQSFYYVAQWAAVFNNTNFPGNAPIPAKLAQLRRRIAGSQTDRSFVTRKVTNPDLNPTQYGHFLVACCSILNEWDSKLRKLAAKWDAAEVGSFTDGNLYHECYPHFRDFTDRGILELVQLAQQYFPGRLSGG